ncbi:MAG: DNA polymerase III subunit delta [Sporolactobacillus sp.]
MAKEKSADLSIQKPLSPVYLLYGTQAYLIQMMKKNILNEALSAEEKEFNFSRYDLTETPLKQALEDAETIPFFGEKKVVVLENAFFLSAERVKSKVEQDGSQLEAYLEQPSPDAIVILIAPYEKLDRRKKIVKILERSAKVHELSRLTDSTIFHLMATIAAKYGSVLTREGYDQLVGSVGPDLGRLAHEVGKCALYCGADQSIDRAIALKIGSRSIETNVFLLVNQVMKKNTAAALHLLHELVRMKEEPLKLLALLERQFRIVYQVCYYQQAGYTQSSMAAKIGIHPFAVKMATDQARLYAPAMIISALKKCSEVDYQIKTGQVDKLMALELLIHQIASAS